MFGVDTFESRRHKYEGHAECMAKDFMLCSRAFVDIPEARCKQTGKTKIKLSAGHVCVASIFLFLSRTIHAENTTHPEKQIT